MNGRGRYRYGSSFVDRDSGVRFEGHHPLERPDLWTRYLDEAEGTYRSHGFEGSLRRQELEDARDVPLFYLGFNDAGEAVAGVRIHGPLESLAHAAILDEMGESPEIDQLRDLIARHIPLGVLEVKGAWSKGERIVGARLITAITRSITHALTWLGAEFAIAAVSDYLLPFGEIAGVRMVGTAKVAYPDERYRTVAVEFYRGRMGELSDDANRQALRREAEELARGPHRPIPAAVDREGAHSRAHRAAVLDVARRSDRETLRVLREDASLQLLDRLDEQRAQLAEIVPPVPPAIVEEGPRWVYFPWRRAAVRLLGPAAYSTLRLDRNRNKITRAEQDRARGLTVAVVGMSAGHSIAHVLAMEGLVGELRLADFDTLELSNLNRIPAGVLDLGTNKAVVAARRIAEIDPYLRVSIEVEGVTAENLDRFLDGVDLVVEECDSLDVKVLVREAARRRGLPVIMETSDRGVVDVERFDLEPDRPIFHGILGDLDSERLAALTPQQKAPFVVELVGPLEGSARGAASMLELGQTVTAWPQLASEVTLGAVTVATAVRRFARGEELRSGRVRVDVDAHLDELGPVIRPESHLDDPLPVDPPLEFANDTEKIVDAARRAPSGGNVQPWRFEADDEEIRFFVLPERTATMDVRHRASLVAVGAALFNARVRASELRRLGPVQLFPEGTKSRLVATLHLGHERDVAVDSLAPYVVARATNRRFGTPAPIERDLEKRLERAVEREGATLRLVTDRAKMSQGADLVAEADRLRFLVPVVHGEMLGELRWPGVDALTQGLDVRTLELDEMGRTAMSLMGRRDVMDELADWQGGSMLGLRTKAALMASSGLALITVPKADLRWYVRGGAAMERFWLECAAAGLYLQPASPVYLFATDDGDLRGLGGERYFYDLRTQWQLFRDYFGLVGGDVPVMLFRVLHAPPPSARSIRLPLSDVLVRTDDVLPDAVD